MKANNTDFILMLYSSPQTVFTVPEIGMLLKETHRENLKSKIHYYVKRKVLTRIRKGIYVKPGYNPMEAGEKIYAPSYVSFETVLQNKGMIFQPYDTIFFAGYLARSIKIGEYDLSYRKIKSEVLTDTKGLFFENNYWIATKERAFLDMIYRFGDYHFDNTGGLDWDKVFSLAGIYNEKKLVKRAEGYYKEYKRNK